jgi:hypothetical protein
VGTEVTIPAAQETLSASQGAVHDSLDGAPSPPPVTAGPKFPTSILVKLSHAQKAKCVERGGVRGMSRWIKSLIDAA